MNKFDHEIDFIRGDIAITGAHSYHSNHHEDRRWRFRYCYLKSGYVAHSCTKTGYVNNWDANIAYTVPSNHILTGFNSHHSNHHE